MEKYESFKQILDKSFKYVHFLLNDSKEQT